MGTGTLTQRRLLQWGLLFGFWTLVGLSFASQFYLSSFKAGVPVTWRQAVGWALADWYVFALLSLPAIRLARRFRLEGRPWGRSVVIHLAASLLFSMTYILLRAGVGQLQSMAGGRPPSFAAAVQPLLVKTWHFNLLIYWVIVSVSHAFDYYRKYQERELRAAELERRLVQARLQALQMQLNPHFLFNTLHAISALMHKDVEAADRMLSQLSDLLRRTLETTDTQEVPLRQELDFLKRYLEIEQARFGDRLRVQMDIAPETLDAWVPNLILQPLLENAIRHGIAPHARQGRIELTARREDGKLVLRVRDNGSGLAAGAPLEEGVGLANTRARLEQLYGSEQEFDLRNAPGGGLAVSVAVPFRVETDASTGAD